METNWIILALIFVCVIGLIIFLVIRNQKDKQDVIESLNAQDDLEHSCEEGKDPE
jgi:preprotein translocase subunit YajC